MPVTVAVRSGGAGEKAQSPDSFSITFDAPVIVIGRGDASDVELPDPSVSHRHATIRQRGSDYILVDEGSTNGTFMGGVKLGAHAPRILKHKDMARVGRVWLEFRFDGGLGPSQTALATKELALSLVARALDGQGQIGGPRVTVIEGPDSGNALALEQGGRVYIIGRGSESDLALEDSDASRRHVQLVRRADQLLVHDLGSKNGAELGGKRLDDRDHAWKPGVELRIGKNLLAYQYGAADALAELERAPDEKNGPDEPLAPPDLDPPAPSRARGRSPPAAQLANAGEPAPGEGARGGGAPIAELPSFAPQSSRAKPGWTGTDFLVVLLALVVFGLSVVGLVWLFRG
jgi:pSer/pThr/pTyr-binding forkhead associated (FHA) protein